MVGERCNRESQDVDQPTRTLGETTSRRRLTRLLTALSASTLGMGFAAKRSAAKRKRRCLIGCNPDISARDPRGCGCCLRNDVASCTASSDCCSDACSGTESIPGLCVGRKRSERCESDAQCASGVCTAKGRCA